MSASVREAWRASDCVCFDVDSTVIAEEGIDVLAAHCGCGESVAEWTRRYVRVSGSDRANSTTYERLTSR